MMKKVFIYYSLTGNGDRLAAFLKEKGYEIRKVEVAKPLPSNFILSLLLGGFKVLINYKETLVNFNNNVAEYDEILIGSPIWNSRISTPIATALQNLDLFNKKVGFIFYSGSGKRNKATDYVKENYPTATIVNLKNPKENVEELNKISII